MGEKDGELEGRRKQRWYQTGAGLDGSRSYSGERGQVKVNPKEVRGVLTGKVNYTR